MKPKETNVALGRAKKINMEKREVISKNSKGYLEILNDLKSRIKTARIRASVSVNSQLIILYWEIGKRIIGEQEEKGWGGKVIDMLSEDLSRSFEDMKGFSVRNLKYMRKFAYLFDDMEFVQQAAAQIPWTHNLILMDKLSSEKKTYLWYANQTILNGWSRNILAHQIESKLYERQGREKVSNFKLTLPKDQSDLADQTLKDPYVFDFLSVGKEAHEREVEKELTKHIQKFLLELGRGFAFVGNQYHLDVAGEDYYVDLLFYHLKLRCYVVIELKAGKFKPEYAGKLNFYLSAVDDMLRHETDNPTIGMILCKDKGGKVMGEYALKDINKPIGLSEYKIIESIPRNLKTDLPTIEELEEELSDKTVKKRR